VRGNNVRPPHSVAYPNELLRKSQIVNSLHRVHQRRQSLDAHFETIADSICPTPLGVPVRITSPGNRVIFVEIKLTSW